MLNRLKALAVAPFMVPCAGIAANRDHAYDPAVPSICLAQSPLVGVKHRIGVAHARCNQQAGGGTVAQWGDDTGRCPAQTRRQLTQTVRQIFWLQGYLDRWSH